MVDTEMPIHRGLEPFKGAARLLEVGVFLDFPLDKIANPRSCSTQSSICTSPVSFLLQCDRNCETWAY